MDNSIQAIVMPKLGLSMTEGMVVKWRVETGARVAPGDVIAEIETSKLTSELEAHGAGVIRGELAPLEVDLPVGALLCVLAGEAATEQQIDEFISGFVPAESDGVEADDGRMPAADTSPDQPEVKPDDAGVPATPMARRLAAAAGLNLAGVTPTGSRGRVTRTDVENAIAARSPEAPADSTTEAAGEGYDEVPLTPMRRAIARRLTESKQTAPHFRLLVDVNIDAALKLRADLNRDRESGKISITDLLVKAVAVALIKTPAVNSQLDGKVIRRYHDAHVAVAVALDDGLLTPVVRTADKKSIVDISREITELSERARSGSLTPPEYEGGTFTLSNLGMFGIKSFDAIINPPQAAILAVGAAEKRRIFSADGEIVATLLTATLSCDHRIIDGATGARFLQVFRELVEQPYQLLF